MGKDVSDDRTKESRSTSISSLSKEDDSKNKLGINAVQYTIPRS